jgi:hypothetical protein
MNDVLRPWIARVAAVLVSGLAGWLFTRYQVETPDDVRGILTTTVEVVIVMLFTYVLTHIPISKKVNPEDAASTGAAKEGKAKQRQRKTNKAIEKRLKQAGIQNRDIEEPPPVPPLMKIPAKEKGSGL